MEKQSGLHTTISLGQIEMRWRKGESLMTRTLLCLTFMLLVGGRMIDVALASTAELFERYIGKTCTKILFATLALGGFTLTLKAIIVECIMPLHDFVLAMEPSESVIIYGINPTLGFMAGSSGTAIGAVFGYLAMKPWIDRKMVKLEAAAQRMREERKALEAVKDK